jgi:hemoglobin-like flavoprotein
VPAPAPVPADRILIAEASLRRCASEAFFQAFYHRLLGVSDEVRAKFAATDFERQNKLLQHGIGLLFSYAKRPNPALLERIAQRHSHADLDVPPIQYHHFTDGLVATVREFDAEFRPDVALAWREAMAPGIDYIMSRYDAAAQERV